MDSNDVARALETKLGADWSHASSMFHNELDAARKYSKTNEGQRETGKRYRELVDGVAEAMLGQWATPENPIFDQLPEGLTADQCATLARLIASRRPAALYLALLVKADVLAGVARG